MALSFAVAPRGRDHLKRLSLYEATPDIYAQDIPQEIALAIHNPQFLQSERLCAFRRRRIS
jgi:hypothetical protein